MLASIRGIGGGATSSSYPRVSSSGGNNDKGAGGNASAGTAARVVAGSGRDGYGYTGDGASTVSSVLDVRVQSSSRSHEVDSLEDSRANHAAVGISAGGAGSHSYADYALGGSRRIVGSGRGESGLEEDVYESYKGAHERRADERLANRDAAVEDLLLDSDDGETDSLFNDNIVMNVSGLQIP